MTSKVDEIEVGNTVRCIESLTVERQWYTGNEHAVVGVRKDIYYLVTERLEDKIKLMGIYEWQSIQEFKKYEIIYSQLSWFRKQYIQCGHWVFIKDFWAYRYSSNTYAYSNRMKKISTVYESG